ncbi:ATP-binding cassette domain-containing protein [Paracoccus sp. JM45]|uniref:ATP-binding cassette domain-containing protein n=1 Tax=Paracoccus sp. JM45 TaxID=2283626 RepID=UPI000E6BC7D1|nr:ATP-binding cassette domain-containing protein [Paracoccus sp. JM45]RJE78497.1 ATP-binding cassette domain-containing protein [Paracoccus sp. JM45]
MTHAIHVEGLTLGYDRKPVIADLTLSIPAARFTALIGPNGCGKSTLLKSVIRTMPPRAGRIDVMGQPLNAMSARALARQVSFLPQVLPVPEGITVRQLVGYGRSPHNNLWGRIRGTDRAKVDEVLARLDITDLAGRMVDGLSGGQRQRVWLAMVLAQNTDIVLLDEPTTFLDINHQVELLRLARDLVATGKTVVAVLHDLNQAFRYADHIVMLRNGGLSGCGSPDKMATTPMLREVFSIDACIHPDPECGRPMVIVRKP